ncbi:oligoendopeptidase F [Gottschalkia acidurici 9a]|uniref:Oligopeptidase F n=1 Tax=Gottschalkia acidurici (strain ATCC 7906 / DSM 604 / BCRC 14475 / CIP 104303 / KCTC 5404 / NCIMB 10678 / 9a) TaxID=1128398 RepID=K0AZ60_GOTA9|nr:oligoendopeptidase F [Gottschalkia acidurici]AFS77980.1 oligoendopeptidase F [Gottschalkia acidurici 9a]
MSENNNLVKERKDINEEYKWNLKSLYESDEKWEEDIKKLKEMSKEIALFKGKIGDSSESLLKTLNLKDEISRIIENLYTYAKMRLDENTTDSKYQTLSDRASSTSVEIEESVSFIVPEILLIEEQKLKQYIKNESDLKIYEHYINEILRQREHILSQEQESIIAQMGELSSAPESIYSMLNNADMKFPAIKNEDGVEIEITHGNFIPLMENKNRKVREEAFKGLYGAYNSFRNTFATSLNSEVKKNIFHAKVRNYDSALESSLDENNINTSVYDNLIDVVNENLNLMHKYVSIRKRLLEIDELHMYDLYTPIIKEVDMKIPYEEAKEIVLKGLTPLGKDYTDIVNTGFNSRWIDVYENRGKRSGAYSWGTYDSDPFILLNYHDTLDNVFTLAHEMGHSMHSYYSKTNQPHIYGGYSIFLAEIASTTNEALLIDYMLKNTTKKEEKLFLLNHYLEQFRGTIFRQTMFAEFERDIHREVENGGALTADNLSEMYKELNKKYYGKDIIVDDEIDVEWARIPHFYYNFYVFQYATGFSAAIDFSQKILEEGESAVDKYKGFLKSGSSEYAIETLKKAGVDMTTKEPVERALKLFGELIEEMESLI